MAQEYCGAADPGVAHLTPRHSGNAATRELRSLRLTAEKPAGRTGELAGRVTALD
jgi:hypothetical protein